MRRLLALWCLTATLLAPFASASEAAEALAESLAELAHPHVIEPGDANEFEGDGHALSIPALKAVAQPGLDGPCSTVSVLDTLPPRCDGRPTLCTSAVGPARSPALPPSAAGRQALLCVFLF